MVQNHTAMTKLYVQNPSNMNFMEYSTAAQGQNIAATQNPMFIPKFNFKLLQPPVPAYAGTEGCFGLLVFFLSFFYLTNKRKNGQKYFGAKYGRMKGLAGKELSVSFTDIRPGVFPGGPKN